MGTFVDMRKDVFGVLVAALLLLLLLYTELYEWEGVHLTVAPYKPAPHFTSINGSVSGKTVRLRMQQTIADSQQRMLQRAGKHPESQKCPAWYNIIREDFKPWSNRQGITPAALFNAWPLAHFRFQIVDGELYVERNWQTMQFKYIEYLRFYYSVWGILQLLERYPGQVPDVDVMMQTFDSPLVDKYQWEANMDPPPLLKYCSTPNHWDITWPDWSFWGWADLELPPWQLELDAIVQANKTAWEERPGHAFWQGGSEQCLARQELWKCEDNEKLRWGIELRHVDWAEGHTVEEKLLESQCRHKFKLYMEGWAWSASGKYILACDATTLMVESEWYEFWYRGLKPGVNFLPVAKAPNLCANIRKAVDWGRAHPGVAKRIGRAGADFLLEEVNMPLVYDYMLHVLREYASLQTFKVQPSQYALKVTAKSWLKDAFDERKSEKKLPRGLRKEVQDRQGIPPEGVRAQMLVEERAEQPPCVIDWETPPRAGLDPRDTVGGIPRGLQKEFEALAAREEEEALAREREEALTREREEKLAQEGEDELGSEKAGEVTEEQEPAKKGGLRGAKKEAGRIGKGKAGRNERKDTVKGVQTEGPLSSENIGEGDQESGIEAVDDLARKMSEKGAATINGDGLLGEPLLREMVTDAKPGGTDEIALTITPLNPGQSRGKETEQPGELPGSGTTEGVVDDEEGLDVRLPTKKAARKGKAATAKP